MSYNYPNFNTPFLVSVVTFEMKDNDCSVQIGVFFCWKKDDKFQITLIWHKYGCLDVLHKLVEIALFFKQLITTDYDWDYKYYSSNCCKIGNRVYRCYDNRLYYTSRSDVAYRDSECTAITGGFKEVVTVQEEVLIVDGEVLLQRKGDIWFKKTDDDKKLLSIISTPFRKGGHVAENTSDFIPIIDKLMKLHSKRYIHGDIRACNMIFGEKNADGKPDGWLIDFDFSRKQLEKPMYPNGYVTYLDDVFRRGESDKAMEKWHDWYALGRVIFDVHQISIQDDAAPSYDYYRFLSVSELHSLLTFWMNIEEIPSDQEINTLKEFLNKEGLKVEGSHRFTRMFDMKRGDVTNAGVTGSPPKNKC